MKKVPRDEMLLKKAEQLGVVTDGEGSFILPGAGEIPVQAPMHEIQRRVLEAERHARERRLWVVAVTTAIFSAIGAIGAWVGVFYK